jgi:hypothetical protein
MEKRYNPTDEQLNSFFYTIDRQLKAMMVTEDQLFKEKMTIIWKESLNEFINNLPSLDFEEWQNWLMLTVHSLWFIQVAQMSKIKAIEKVLGSGLSSHKGTKIYRETFFNELEKGIKAINVLNQFGNAVKQKEESTSSE